MKSLAAFALTAFMLAMFPHISRCDENSRLWPIDAARRISSSFGEPRTGRFHYGMDFKSDGAIGKKVFAIGDGYISRVKTSPAGYGKVLYLTLDSGETIVYAHLSAFQRTVEDSLFLRRIREKTYDVQWWPGPNNIRVKKGDVIARSGDSGSWGAPHLHMEIRDRNNISLNLLEQGYEVADTIPPIIKAVILIPLDRYSTIDGGPFERWIPTHGNDIQPVRLTGRIGVAASVWDRANGARNLLGVYDISLAVDSTTVFSKTYDHLSYELIVSDRLDYLPGEYYGGEGIISALFRKEGNRLELYKGNGVIDCDSPGSEGPHTLVVTAGDFPGNQTEVAIPVVFGTAPRFLYYGTDAGDSVRFVGRYSHRALARLDIIAEPETSENSVVRSYPASGDFCDISVNPADLPPSYQAVLVGSDSVSTSSAMLKTVTNPQNADNASATLTLTTALRHDRAIITVTSNEPLASVPVLSANFDQGTSGVVVCPAPVSDTVWAAAVPITTIGSHMLNLSTYAFDKTGSRITAEDTVAVTVFNTKNRITCTSQDGVFSATSTGNSLFRPAPVMLTVEETKTEDDLSPLTPGYRINLGDPAMRDALVIKIAAGDSIPPTTALYFRNGNGNGNGHAANGNGHGWRFLSNDREEGCLAGKIYKPGCIAMFNDTTAPYLRPLSPRPGGTIKTRSPLLKVYAEDKGAGFEGSDSVQMTIDGIPVYGEYNPKAHTISYRIRNGLRPGKHTVEVTAADQVGNTSSRTWSFNIQ